MPTTIPPIVRQGSVIRKEDPNRYADFLISLSLVRSGLTVLRENARQEGIEAELPKRFVEEVVIQAVEDGSQPGVLNYWGNMELSR